MTTHFSADYFEARDRFRQASQNLGWQLESHIVYQDLTLDVAFSPGESRLPTIMISSGLHGAEGLFGSAVQLALLEQPWAQSVRWVFLHSLNPYGFAHVRRCNEENVDLNRNFLLPTESYAGSPSLYAELDNWINPADPVSWWDLFWWHAISKLGRYGMKPLQQAIGEGQYEFPRGLMFGGKAPSRTLLLLQENLKRWVGNSSHVLHLDFHTGLGQFATYQLLMDTEISPDRLQLWQRYFETQSSAVIVSDQGQKTYRPRGSFGQWCQQQLMPTSYTYFCAEFGTYSTLKVLRGLRLENQAHHWQEPSDPHTQSIKAQFQELFCPQSVAWRRTVIQKSLDLVAQSIQATLDLSGKSLDGE